MHDKIRDNVLKSLEKRGETCERNLRAVVQKRKESAQQERDREKQKGDWRQRRKGVGAAAGVGADIGLYQLEELVL